MSVSLLKRLCIAILTTCIVLRVQGQDQACLHPANYSDFSIVSINNRIYLTGGNPHSLDIWSLDLSQGLNTSACLSWQPPDDSVDPPTQFQPFMYGVGFRSTNDSLYVLAGDSTSAQMSQLCEYNSTGWQSPPTFGTLPSPRADMTAAPNGSLVHFYGGRMTQAQRSAGQEAYFNDFYIFNTDTMTWNWPNVRYIWGQRPARFGHTANMIMNRMFVLGGKVAVVNSTDNTWIVHPADFQSVLVYDTVENIGVSMLTTGDIPAARLRFSAVSAPDGKSIVIFGGQNASSTVFDATQDVYVLDTCTLSWSKPTVSGNAPSARAGHEALAYGKYMLAMMGYTGYSSVDGLTYVNDVVALDMTTWTWIDHVPAQGPLPTVYPGCRFEFPNIPSDSSNINGDGDGNSLPYDPTVVSNPNSANNSSSKAIGIGLGVSATVLCLLGLGYYAYRNHKRPSSPSTPWLSKFFPSQALSQSQQDGQLRTPPPAVTKSNIYPMAVYSNQGEKVQNSDNTEQPPTQKKGIWDRLRHFPTSAVHNPPKKSYWRLDDT